MTIRLSYLAVVALIASCTAFPVLAQDKKPADALVKYSIQLDNCVKPALPEKRPTAAQAKLFADSMDSYRNCLSDYTGELRRYAEAHNKAAAAYINAANLAIEEYNAYIKSVSEATEEKKKP